MVKIGKNTLIIVFSLQDAFAFGDKNDRLPPASSCVAAAHRDVCFFSWKDLWILADRTGREQLPATLAPLSQEQHTHPEAI